MMSLGLARAVGWIVCLGLLASGGMSQATRPAGVQEEGGAGPLVIDREKGQVRVLCQALRVDMPLEFFCVLWGTADHESVLRTRVKPSDIHAALLALGLEPGSPLRFLPQSKTWLPPTGPPVAVFVEWEHEGRFHREPAGRLMKDLETGQPMPHRPFVFSGSRVLEDGVYGADITGQLVSLVNFEYSLMDVPELASNANETLEWEINPDMMPPEGQMVWMVLEPVAADDLPATVADDPHAGASSVRQTIVVMVTTASAIITIGTVRIAPRASGTSACRTSTMTTGCTAAAIPRAAGRSPART